jgi:stage II sporulation protein AA (anti-sigma F factor antagonist)
MKPERSVTMKPASGQIAGAPLPAAFDVVVVRLPEVEYGSLDNVKLAEARRRLLDLANQPGSPHLIIDLSGVCYLGAGLIGVVVYAWDRLKKQGQRLVLCGLNPDCARLFHTLNLDRLFAIHPTLLAALEEIGAHLRAGPGEVRTAPVVVQVSDVGWDPDLLRLEYLADDGEPLRCVIVPRRE